MWKPRPDGGGYLCFTPHFSLFGRYDLELVTRLSSADRAENETSKQSSSPRVSGAGPACVKLRERHPPPRGQVALLKSIENPHHTSICKPQAAEQRGRVASAHHAL